MSTKRAAIFDVDGTLVDTNHLHVVTWWEAFRQGGHRVPMREIHRAVGLGSGDLIEHLLGKDRDTGQDDQFVAAHHALYATYFDRLPALDSARELLRALAGRGWEIVLATSASGAELAALRGRSGPTTSSSGRPARTTSTRANRRPTPSPRPGNWPECRATGPCSSATPSGT